MATVNVPQETGEIRVSENGGPPTVYEVTGGRITVDDPAAAALLALVVPDATVAGVSAADLEELETVSPAFLAGMSAADLVNYVEAHPEVADAVLAAEAARPGGPRSTVTAAAERAAAGG